MAGGAVVVMLFPQNGYDGRGTTTLVHFSLARVLALPCLMVPLVVMGCGSRTDTVRALDAGVAPPSSSEERCNGLDDDGIDGVDQPFRDAQGRYVADAHCGACNAVCSPRSNAELEAHCSVVDAVARCMATRCAPGYGPTREGRCMPLVDHLCLPCAQVSDCGPLAAARCATIAGEARCAIDCAAGCPAGYRCESSISVCVPEGGSCSCDPGDRFELACATGSTERDAGTPVCVGRASCSDGVMSACQTAVERCDHVDNDCDGEIDEGFRDERGVYSLDAAHCGECGISCLEDTGTDLELSCGGDPFAPRCTLACPDARDGVGVGDLLDGDLDVATGCECRVTAIHDEPGPRGARADALDVNCDGADGDVLGGVYVAPDGDDAAIGSPTRPLRTIGAAIARARSTQGSALVRAHVYIAAGTYAETLELADGVQLHGGYRRDFRTLDPAAFVVEVRAPASTSAPGGAVLVARDVGGTPTLVEGLTLRGLDAAQPESATVGAYLERPGSQLTLRGLRLRAGVPGEGRPGGDGPAGRAPSAPAFAGEPPRAALEEGSEHVCVASAANRVRGGVGGQNVCEGSDVHGGAGGAAECPSDRGQQGSGERGAAASGIGGAGGAGGQNAHGPLLGTGCDRDVCCGLADFEVSSLFAGPSGGGNGRAGMVGAAGAGCGDPRGNFVESVWRGGRGSAGGAGQAGAGGGGGGAGGGVLMDYFDGVCEFADGLGGAGGGGGAGGCGGAAGSEGTSGGPSIALLVIGAASFAIDDVSFEPASGGRGGPGGAGGDGGPGGVGAFGGAIAPELRITPTLAGTFPGARGGSGGAGGSGGGGGGGCGGSSIGIWVVGADAERAATWRMQNRFVLGVGGEGGAGGGGAQTASAGRRGEASDVVVQR